MKAFYATAWGGPEVMRYGDLPEPTPGKGQIRVAVRASSVNPVDYKTRNGIVRWIPGQHLPRPLGTDVAGVVDAVGPGVTTFSAGDRVYGLVVVMYGHPGAHAQVVNVSARRMRRMPEGLGFVEAAALPASALTALNGLRLAGDLASKRVLVNGGTGGVGHFAVQMARARGATVTAVCRGSQADRARALGAQTVLDYQTQDYTAGAERHDFILDTHPGVGFSRASRVLDRGGAYASSLPSPALMVHVVASSLLRGRRAYVANASDSPDDYAELERRLAAREFAPVIEHVFPLSEAAKAFSMLEAGGVVGKVMLEVT